MARGRKKQEPKFSGELTPEQKKTKQQRISDAVKHVAQQLELVQSAQRSITYHAKNIQSDYGFSAKTVRKLGQMKFQHSKEKILEEAEELGAAFEIYVESVVKAEEEQDA